MIAEANGLTREWVLVGNGGDELLFNTALAWGGPQRNFLNFPPTFSVYAANARLTNTNVIDIPRKSDDLFGIDEDAAIAALQDKARPVHYAIIANPNNPTGKMSDTTFLNNILKSTDALVMVDEAYFEFSRNTMRPYLEENKNLVILRTFSKAFSLAGVRLGYILAHPDVIREYIKVRQPYSVDAVSQAIARVVYANRSAFEPAIDGIIAERERLIEGLRSIPGIKAFPSDSCERGVATSFRQRYSYTRFQRFDGAYRLSPRHCWVAGAKRCAANCSARFCFEEIIRIGDKACGGAHDMFDR